MATKQELINKYADRLSSKGKTRALYLRIAQEFLDYAGGDYGKEKVGAFIKHLQYKRHYKDSSLNFAFRIIRTLYNRNGMDWPFARGEAPVIREGDVDAPALDPELIREMIKGIREQGTAEEKAFLALSTTYGLRRAEMMNITPEDISYRSRTIHIATLKHGRERSHLIPAEIMPYLQGYDFSQRISEFHLFQLWYQIEHKIDLEHIEHSGFHSIRRTLDTLLLKSLPQVTVRSFLRWKQRTSGDMAYRYSAVQFVGREGKSTEIVGEALTADQDVFKVHPFLPYWK